MAFFEGKHTRWAVRERHYFLGTGTRQLGNLRRTAQAERVVGANTSELYLLRGGSSAQSRSVRTAQYDTCLAVGHLERGLASASQQDGQRRGRERG